jgi:hypothetical protein
MPICNGAVTPIAGMEILPKLSSCETTVACDGWGEKKENNEMKRAPVVKRRRNFFTECSK